MTHGPLGTESGGELEKLRNELVSLKLSNEQLQQRLSTAETEVAESKRLTDEMALSLKAAEDALLQPDSVERVGLDPIIGSFNSREVRTGPPTWTTASKTVHFSREHSTPPGIAIGFSKLDVSSDHNMRITTYASNLLNSSFDINIDGCDGTQLHGIGCDWLEISAKNPDLQFGRFNTHDHAPWTKAGRTNQRNVTFQRPYTSPPQVLVWLSAFDLDSNKGWRMGAYADNVTSTGFKIHLDVWGDTVLRSVVLSWVAYPKGMAGMMGGTFDTVAMRPHKCPQPYNSAYITFPAGGFPATPRVMAVISAIDIDPKAVMRLQVSISSLSATGMLWHLNAWDDTVLYYARASYIAFG